MKKFTLLIALTILPILAEPDMSSPIILGYLKNRVNTALNSVNIGNISTVINTAVDTSLTRQTAYVIKNFFTKGSEVEFKMFLENIKNNPKEMLPLAVGGLGAVFCVFKSAINLLKAAGYSAGSCLDLGKAVVNAVCCTKFDTNVMHYGSQALNNVKWSAIWAVGSVATLGATYYCSGLHDAMKTV